MPQPAPASDAAPPDPPTLSPPPLKLCAHCLSPLALDQLPDPLPPLLLPTLSPSLAPPLQPITGDGIPVVCAACAERGPFPPLVLPIAPGPVPARTPPLARLVVVDDARRPLLPPLDTGAPGRIARECSQQHPTQVQQQGDAQEWPRRGEEEGQGAGAPSGAASSSCSSRMAANGMAGSRAPAPNGPTAVRQARPTSSHAAARARQLVASYPLMDITRLRVRSRGYRCLYPGATFQGLQESGKNSYDVTVTIVDVDIGSAFLCGYLCIRGLTEDWPEMTTYFDAQIIGSRHGFLTQDWGATEKEDMMHWSRFLAFRNVRHELRRPGLTIPDVNRGAVFMRWKERFLVPDHRVQDINGASFAGFYYVCVDFNPSTSSRVCAPRMTPSSSMESESPTSAKPEPERPESLARDGQPRSPSYSCARGGLGAATMSGFYYHQNSEPYQQLSLCHVPETHTSGFEFR